jgi:nicotinate phosphoribosyltransferase
MPWVDDRNAALLTDLYELTMAASYHKRGMNAPATFELFVRRLPANRNFLVACGLDDALSYLEKLSFDDEAIGYLRSLGPFDEAFLDYLRAQRFSGDAWAIDEGEAFFANEPVLQITAPLIEAQIVETFLLNCLTFQTMIASKAARLVIACQGRRFVDFSPRRDHGADAALKAARASFIGGASATSNVLGGSVYGLPLAGTMAHSYVMAFDDEMAAFRAYADDFPTNVTLLLDTYDTVAAAHKVVELVRERRAAGLDIRPGWGVQAVRLDSGDLDDLARQVRAILDAGGCGDVRIFASGDLDEYRIAELVAAGAPIDAFGVGTQLGTSGDAPAVSGVYKLVEYAGTGRVKLSPGKETLPGRKQVYRFERDGRYDHDVLAFHDEGVSGGRPLLRQVMKAGKRLAAAATLAGLQARCRRTLAALPERLRSLEEAGEPYPVDRSAALTQAIERL